MAEHPPRPKKSVLEEDDFLTGKNRPAKKMSKGERAAAKEAKRLYGGVSPTEIASPAVAETMPIQAEEPIVPLNPMPQEFRETEPKTDFITEQLAVMAAKKMEENDINAPQYAPRDMQKELDDRIAAIHAEEKSDAEGNESLPSVFHSNRAPNIIVNREDAVDQEHIQELFGDIDESMVERPDGWKTRAELYTELRGLLGKFGEGAKEKFGYLGNRIKELDAALAPKAEKFAEKIGDAYNKAPLWQKITLGTLLTVGYGFTLPVSTVAAGLFGGTMALQRGLGLAGTFRNFEKKFEEVNKGEATGKLANTRLYKWLGSGSETERKNKAMAGAVIYSLGLSGTMSLAAHELADYHIGEKIGEWMRSHIVGGEIGAAATSSVVSEAAPSPQGHPSYETQNFAHPETPQPMAPDAGVPTAAPDFKPPEIASQPAVAVEVTHVPEAPITHAPVQPEVSTEVPTATPEATEVAPTPEPISSSEITEGPNVDIDDETRRKALEFATPSSTEAPVAPPEMPVTTPEASIETPAPEAPAPIIEQVPVNEPPPFETPASPVETSIEAPVVPPEAPVASFEAPVTSTEVPVVPVEAPITHFETPVPEQPQLEQITLPEQQSVQTIDMTHEQDIANQYIAETTPAQAVTEQAQSIVNHFGIEVSTVEPHIYADPGAENLFVYGGSPAEKASAIFKYLTENPDKAVYSADDNGEHRILRRLVEGKLVPDAPARVGFWAGLFSGSSFMKAPTPDEFQKLIK
jgi:hypothetical protein